MWLNTDGVAEFIFRFGQKRLHSQIETSNQDQGYPAFESLLCGFYIFEPACYQLAKI